MVCVCASVSVCVYLPDIDRLNEMNGYYRKGKNKRALVLRSKEKNTSGILTC